MEDHPPDIVFVDGIGGRRLLRKALLRRFEARGHNCHYFGYRPSRESFETIRHRLGDRLITVATRGPYLLIGYSFGGVPARSALTVLPATPLPLRLVLVASPMHSLRRCRRFADLAIFRWLTGDCGKLLASESSMQDVAVPKVPTTCIYGTKGYAGPLALGGRAINDGMIAVAAIDPQSFDDVLAVRASHPFIATSRSVMEAIETCIGSDRRAMHGQA